MNASIISSLLRDWGTDPLFWIAITALPLIGWALRRKRRASRHSSRRRHSKHKSSRFLGFVFTGTWLAVLLGVSAPVVVNPMVDAWEMQFPLDETCPDDSPIVLLGAGLDKKAEFATQTEYLYPSAHIRSARASAMASQYPDSPVLVSGAGLHQITEADMMREYLEQRGIASERITMDEQSQNTYDSAVNLAKIVQLNEWTSKVRLVTSALHMPRAIKVFENRGLTPCAIPVEFLAVKEVPWYAIAPQTTALSKFRTYVHERIGLMVYQAKGLL